MFKKILLLSIATFAVLCIFYYAGENNQQKTKSQVRGAQTKNLTNDIQDIPNDEVNTLLKNIAQSYNMEKIEIFNTSFKWVEDEKVYDLLGFGLLVEKSNISSWTLKNILIQNGFVQTEYPYGDTLAYSNSDINCVVKQNFFEDNKISDSIEIRCAYLDLLK